MVRRWFAVGLPGLALGLVAALVVQPSLGAGQAVSDEVAARVKGGQYCNTPYGVTQQFWVCGDVCTNNPAATCPKHFQIVQGGPYRAQSVSSNPFQCMDCGGGGYCGGGTLWTASGCFGPPSPGGTPGS
jgi:hypothetical protein